MLTDPQSITINAVPISLPRIDSGNNGAVYSSSDGNHTLTVSHAYGRRNRRVARIDVRKVAADPLTSVNAYVSSSVYVVFDHPKTGFSTTEMRQICEGLTAFLNPSNSTGATAKLLGGES